MREIKKDITQIRTKEWRNKADWGEWGNTDWETEINEKKKTDQRDWNNEEKLKKLRTNTKTGEKSKKQYKERNKK
jgi:hypothetical protein